MSSSSSYYSHYGNSNNAPVPGVGSGGVASISVHSNSNRNQLVNDVFEYPMSSDGMALLSPSYSTPSTSTAPNTSSSYDSGTDDWESQSIPPLLLQQNPVTPIRQPTQSSIYNMGSGRINNQVSNTSLIPSSYATNNNNYFSSNNNNNNIHIPVSPQPYIGQAPPSSNRLISTISPSRSTTPLSFNQMSSPNNAFSPYSMISQSSPQSSYRNNNNYDNSPSQLSNTSPIAISPNSPSGSDSNNNDTIPEISTWFNFPSNTNAQLNSAANYPPFNPQGYSMIQPSNNTNNNNNQNNNNSFDYVEPPALPLPSSYNNNNQQYYPSRFNTNISQLLQQPSHPSSIIQRPQSPPRQLQQQYIPPLQQQQPSLMEPLPPINIQQQQQQRLSRPLRQSPQQYIPSSQQSVNPSIASRFNEIKSMSYEQAQNLKQQHQQSGIPYITSSSVFSYNHQPLAQYQNVNPQSPQIQGRGRRSPVSSISSSSASVPSSPNIMSSNPIQYYNNANAVNNNNNQLSHNNNRRVTNEEQLYRISNQIQHSVIPSWNLANNS